MNGSNNAVFIALAPFDDPQIAVSVVLETRVVVQMLGAGSKRYFDKYFNLTVQIQLGRAYKLQILDKKCDY